MVKIKFEECEPISRNIEVNPFKKHTEDAGWDLITPVDTIIEPGKMTQVRTGIKVEIPKGFEIQIWPRGSGTFKGLYIHPGTIDSNYRGEIVILVTPLLGNTIEIKAGERIAQAKLAKVINTKYIQAKEGLSNTKRGEGKLGSTNN